MMIVEMSFPVSGSVLPADNGYGLYAAISTAFDGHLPPEVAISSLRGPRIDRRLIQVTRGTRLRVRIAVERIGEILPLAGRFLNVLGHEIGLGVPQVSALTPAPKLEAHLVTIKGFLSPGPFLGAVSRQLETLGVDGRACIPVFEDGPRKGESRRRVIRIKEHTVVGFPVTVDGLSDADSSRVLAHGLGGRRHMGCGIFTPVREPKGGVLDV